MEQPDIIFLWETKCSVDKIKELSRKLGRRFEIIEVTAHGSTGRLAIGWNPQSLILLDVEAMRSYLSLEMQVIGTPESLAFTNVYGTQRTEEKIKLLQDLREIRTRKSHLPGVLRGDFNMINSLSKKKGGQRRIDRDVEAFKEFIEDANLINMEIANRCFPWSNKHGGNINLHLGFIGFQFQRIC